MNLRHLLCALAATGAAAALAPATAPAAAFTSCSGSDRANGITSVRVSGTSCATGLAVAKRTNSVKCFLNGTRCTHRFRGAAWTCTLTEGSRSSRVECRAGSRRVRYRLG